jgi:phosphoserine phosphatase SerB
MPVEHILTLICPVISQREVEGLITWAHSILGPSLEQQVHPLIEPAVGDGGASDALRIDLHFQWSDPAAYPALRAKFYQATLSTPPPVALHAASLVPSSVKKAVKKLFVFDMDSTFINQEVIDEIGREIGAYDRFAEITESAMKGQIDFIQAFQQRVGMLKGLFHERALDILPRITLSPGIEPFIKSLQRTRVRTMIVSGGFDFVLRHFQAQLGIDEVHGHELNINEDGLFDGTILGDIIDGARKQLLVHEYAHDLGLSRDELVIVGDGANDMKMMAEAGTQVSFQGKDKLSRVVNTWILDRHYRWLRALL